jgi:hypothetical protein
VSINDQRPKGTTMSDRQTKQATREWKFPRRACVWDILLAEDDTEVDPELLAAFAAGRLDPQQHEVVRQLVARSPKAMDMLDSLQTFLEESENVESIGATKSRAMAVPVRPAADQARSRMMMLALAASLLLAAMLGYLALRPGRTIEVAELEQAILGMRAVADSAWFGDSDTPPRLTDREIHRGVTAGVEERLARIDAVIRAAQQLIQAKDETAELLNLRAAAYIARGDVSREPAWYDLAKEDLNKALALESGYKPALFNLNLVMEAQNRSNRGDPK